MFILQHWDPEMFFPDVNSLVGLALDMRSGQMRKVPRVDLWFCGFECDNYSGLNIHHGAAQGSIAAGRGPSGQTTQGCISYVQSRRPSIVIMENVRNLNSRVAKGTETDPEVLAATFRGLGYLVVYERLNARHVRCSPNRERYYIVCLRVSDTEVVKGAEAEHPWLDEFSTLLRSFTSSETFSVDQFLLADDDPSVVAHIVARKAQAKATAAVRKDAKGGKEYLVKHLEAYQNAGLRWPPDPAEEADLYAALQHLSRKEMECAWYHTLACGGQCYRTRHRRPATGSIDQSKVWSPRQRPLRRFAGPSFIQPAGAVSSVAWRS